MFVKTKLSEGLDFTPRSLTMKLSLIHSFVATQLNTSWAKNNDLIGRLSFRIAFFGFSILCLNLSITSPAICLQDDSVKYQPNWQSLDSRPNPQWYRDAKFGIFIHWGVYSVPAWGPKGSYAEWYLWRLVERYGSTRIWHNKNFGEDFQYMDFAPMFKAELFDPKQWAELFQQSGARYVVLTSKHHDGFCLWPNEQTPNWNSIDVGPKRDLLGDLTKEVRKKGLKMGLYYSLYEWYHPLYKSAFERYVDEYMIPQFKDVVTRYKPSLIFSDGEWEHSSKEWKSEEFLAWLFNESPAPDDVVINDRWGNDTRSKHGGYYTTEYENVQGGISAKLIERVWEECRGMGASFGYNRNEGLQDYQTAESLIKMLIEIVSKGGNLLLNVGPTSDGRIPLIMQDRLIEIGRWLAVNGEAIYATQPNRTFAQGTNIRYTRSNDGKFVYAILLNKLEDTIKLTNLHPVRGSTITMFGVDESLDWRISGDDVAIQIPEEIRTSPPCDYAYSLKIEAKPHVETPQFISGGGISIDEPMKVQLRSITKDAVIYYTLDGQIPTEKSSKYEGSITLYSSVEFQARAFKAGYSPSLIARSVLSILDSQSNGVEYAYFEGEWSNLPNFSELRPIHTGQVYDFNIDSIQKRDDNFAIVMKAFINIIEDGEYIFYTISDDGSKLLIDKTEVVNNDGIHARQERNGTIFLRKGRHPIEIQFFERGGGELLEVLYEGPRIKKQVVPAFILFQHP